MVLWLFLIALLLFAIRLREDFVDPDSPVIRPAILEGGGPTGLKEDRPSRLSGAWQSRIDAEAPIGGNDEDYIKILQAFYDKVYEPSPTRPKDTDVEAFLKTPDAQIAGVDPNALRKIIANGFRVEITVPASEREKAAVKFQPTEALQPKDGVDQVYDRTEIPYVPADSRKGDLPEGLYAPVSQQEEPRRQGIFDDKSTSWTQSSFFSTCEPDGLGITSREECAKNVL